MVWTPTAPNIPGERLSRMIVLNTGPCLAAPGLLSAHLSLRCLVLAAAVGLW
eukprot:COSAG02_NODE_53671_length_300_cov_0.805970_2_plen_51_part_01